MSPEIVLDDEDCAIRYVNVYQIERRYGGPEEGGWWYDSGTPVKSIACPTVEEAAIVRATLRERYPTTKNRYSVMGGDDFDVMVEDGFAEAFPATRPHYE